MKRTRQIPINTTDNGCCPTIVTSLRKAGINNTLPTTPPAHQVYLAVMIVNDKLDDK